MAQETSRYADNPRVLFQGRSAYVDFTGTSSSWYIGEDARGGFKIVPPGDRDEIEYGFDTFDDAIGRALQLAG